MATSLALAKRASADRSLSFLRLSLNFLRGFSTASSQNPSSSPSSASKKPKRKKKKNLFEVAQFLPNWGIGYHMAKTHWTGISYEITKINLYKDGRHGKAWGIVHKDDFMSLDIIPLPGTVIPLKHCRDELANGDSLSLKLRNLYTNIELVHFKWHAGLPPADVPKKISGVHKRCWRYVPKLTKSIGSESSATKPAENDAQAA